MLFFYFIFVILSSGRSANVFGKIRKSSLTFGGPRVSLCVGGLTANHYFWCSRVFLAVLRVLWDVPGCSGVFRECSGVFRGCSGSVPGCSWSGPGCSVVFRGVPLCSGLFRMCCGFYRHPRQGYASSASTS